MPLELSALKAFCIHITQRYLTQTLWFKQYKSKRLITQSELNPYH